MNKQTASGTKADKNLIATFEKLGIDINAVLAEELARRGFNADGKHVGFSK